MVKCIVSPTQAGYSMQRGAETLRVELDGGAGRYRLDVSGAPSRVTVQWICSDEEYFYLSALYRSNTISGSEPFTIDLILDQREVQEFTVNWIPNGPSLQAYEYPYCYVSAELEVIPLAISSCMDGYVCMTNGFGWYSVNEWSDLVVLDGILTSMDGIFPI